MVAKRNIIWFYFRLGKSITETHADLEKVYEEDAPAMSTVHYWFVRFREGETSVVDKQRTGRPVDKEAEESVAAVLEEMPYSSARQISERTGRSLGTVLNVLHIRLGLQYFNLRWVPHMLSEGQKAERVEGARILLGELERLGKRGMSYVLTSDE